MAFLSSNLYGGSNSFFSFTAMRIAVVTCKLKPPSADCVEHLETAAAGIKVASPVPTLNGIAHGSSVGLPATASNNDEFVRELIQLCNFHGKTKQVKF